MTEGAGARRRQAEEEIGAAGERLVYLSVPPGAMADMVRMLGASGHCAAAARSSWRSHSVTTSRALASSTPRCTACCDEESIYRIDHFLGKEAAQNILALRFANGLLEPIWTRDHISYVQIDVPEAIDIQGRAGFYEQTGAFRDMVVTHLLQILGIVALEPPSRIDADALHIERTKVFDALRPLDPERVVFGQYEGYRDEHGVSRRLPAARRLSRSRRGSTAGDGAAFRSTCAPARRWRRDVAPSRSGSPKRRCESSRRDGRPYSCRPSELVFELSDDPQVRFELQAKIPGPS